MITWACEFCNQHGLFFIFCNPTRFRFLTSRLFLTSLIYAQDEACTHQRPAPRLSDWDVKYIIEYIREKKKEREKRDSGII
jgi:hypothetical protein